VTWATTYGRYIMITTEIIVLLAFISRFSLDRKNTDLTEEINQKQAILEANTEFEQTIRSLQDRIKTADTLMAHRSEPIDIVTHMELLLPADVYMDMLSIRNNKLTIEVRAGSTYGFAQVLSNLQSVQQLKNVALNSIKKDAVSGISFQVTADVDAGQ